MDTPETPQPLVGTKLHATIHDACMEDIRRAETKRVAYREDEANPGTTYHVGSRAFPCLTFALCYAHALERLGARPKITRDDGSLAYDGRFHDAPH